MRSHARGLVDNQDAVHIPILSFCQVIVAVPLCVLLWLNLSTTEVTETRKIRPTKAEEEESQSLDPARARERVFQRAGKLLAAKARSIEELRERLLEGRGATEEIVDTVIERLREYGYLDDARFAQSYASLRVQQRPIGRQRLERDLWLKKIDKQTVDAALDQVFAAMPEERLIDRAIEKRVRLRGKPKTRAEAKKLFDHLLRQGFSFELVGDKVRALSKSDDEDPGQ
jgi:regulatory protein